MRRFGMSGLRGRALLMVFLVALAGLAWQVVTAYPQSAAVVPLLVLGVAAWAQRRARLDAMELQAMRLAVAERKQAILHARLRDEHVLSMSPREYEQFIARQLELAGWAVIHCGRQGDQGCDVLAELRGFKAVCQVKLYRSRVGNQAVQQVIATRRHNKAQIMVVVAPAGFTLSAIELAESNGVHLLHHSALHTLESVARIP